MIRVRKASGLGLVVGQTRVGFQAYGVPSGGAINALSLARANALLGNPTDAAGLELTGYFVFEVVEPCSAAVGPAGAKVTLDGAPLAAGQMMSLETGSVLRIQGASQGLWTQLAVQGGFDFPEVLGGRGTCLAGGFGGLEGRTLLAGDCLAVQREEANTLQAAPPRVAMPALESGQGRGDQPVLIRAVRGPEFARLSQASFNPEMIWTLNINSSRMGYRLDPVEPNSTFASDDRALSLSSSYACSPGLIQVPPSGNAVVLMADCQVTGGYPRLGSVLSSELWKVAMLMPGQSVQFDWVSLSNACHYNDKAQREWLRFEGALKAFRGEI